MKLTQKLDVKHVTSVLASIANIY